MDLRIPICGDSFNWTAVADDGLWYPSLDKIVHNTAALQWNTNHTHTNNMLFSEIPTATLEDDSLVLLVGGEEIGILNVYSGEITGLCYQKYQLEWNRKVLRPSEGYSTACEKTLTKMISGMGQVQLLDLFLCTHKLTRDTREELMLELCKQYVFRNGGLS